jgi:hypothetical protein
MFASQRALSRGPHQAASSNPCCTSITIRAVRSSICGSTAFSAVMATVRVWRPNCCAATLDQGHVTPRASARAVCHQGLPLAASDDSESVENMKPEAPGVLGENAGSHRPDAGLLCGVDQCSQQSVPHATPASALLHRRKTRRHLGTPPGWTSLTRPPSRGWCRHRPRPVGGWRAFRRRRFSRSVVLARRWRGR